jgi:16S rRNA processing protein RimM
VDGYFEFGFVKRAFGLKGEVVVKSDADEPEAYLGTEVFFVEDSGLALPWFVQSMEPNPDRSFRIKFEHLSSESEARECIKTKLFLPESALPDPGEDGFYYHEIVGFELWDVSEDGSRNRVGVIVDVIDRNQQDLLEVESGTSRYLIPLTDDWILEFNRAEKRFDFRLPPGLLEVFQNPKD